jgi:hypothetical protein
MFKILPSVQILISPFSLTIGKIGDKPWPWCWNNAKNDQAHMHQKFEHFKAMILKQIYLVMVRLFMKWRATVDVYVYNINDGMGYMNKRL